MDPYLPHLASLGCHVTGLVLTLNFSCSTLSPSGLDRLQESKEDLRELGLLGNTVAFSVGAGGLYSSPCLWEYMSGVALGTRSVAATCVHSSV